GLVAGFDTGMPFLAHISNPDLYVGIGSPVHRRIGDVFRANSMFNDPNILAGFLAAAIIATIALRQYHAEVGRRGRAAAEAAALFLMGACLFLTQSRSGVVALVAGVVTLFTLRPRAAGRPGLWIAAAAALALMIGVAMMLRVDPTLLGSRFAG